MKIAETAYREQVLGCMTAIGRIGEVFLFTSARSDPSSVAGSLWFSEQDQEQVRRLAVGGPRRNGAHVCQRSADLAFHDVGRHSVTAPVRGHACGTSCSPAAGIDDGQPSARFERGARSSRWTPVR